MYDIDKIRKKEYPGLNKTCYLDYGGATPYAKSLVDISAKLWKSGLYGNPHSNSSSSLRATECVNQARQSVLEFFRADPKYFDVVFVANATAAIKLVAHSFQEKGFWYGYHTDAHTSLVGVRELANEGYHCFGSDQELDEWIEYSTYGDHADCLPVNKDTADGWIADQGIIRLIGYPAQSNMNGHRTPKEWAKRIRQRSYPGLDHVYTLLDAAAYCSSAQLDLSDPDAVPDFTSVSFYKIFGMPDLGALIVRKSSSDILISRRYFGGGTVDMVIAFDKFHARKNQNIHEILEDGTVPFHSLVMLHTGIMLHKRLFHSMDEISEHASQLACRLYTRLSQLRHANGRPVCVIYRDPGSVYGDGETQGPTIAFNLCMSNGAWVRHDHFEALASACNIQIRTGGVCNPGGIAGHLRLASWEMKRNYFEGFRCGQPFKIRGGKPTGVIRASLGGMSNERDVETFVAFVQRFFVDGCHQRDDHAVFGKNLIDPQRVWSVKCLQIFPVRYCSPWLLPSSQAWELDYSGFAMDGEWCLINTETQNLIKDSTVTGDLMVYIDLEVGLLCMKSTKSGEPDSEVGVDLWELPSGDWVPTSLEETERGTQRLARKYTAKDLEEFLTLVLGQPTTLARFYEFPEKLGEEQTAAWSEKAPVQQAREGIFIQISGDVTRPNVHILLNRTESNEATSGDFPQLFRFGSQTLVYSSTTSESSVARYDRLPDTEETLVSQNTTVCSTDIVTEVMFGTISSRKDGLPDCNFCPVVGCHEKYNEYSIFLQHLTSHASSFVRPRRRRCWFG